MTVLIDSGIMIGTRNRKHYPMKEISFFDPIVHSAKK
jgi:hypothetical protein